MPQKHNPFAPVRAVIHLLASLTHDEHRDLADMLTADAASDWRGIPPRHGLPPLDPERGHALILDGGWQYRDDPPLYTPPARRELHDAYEATEALPPEARALVADVARQIQRALAPVAERRTAQDGTPLAAGTIQAKIIRRKVLNLDTGETEIKSFGPYLYYRYWQSGGNADKRGKRLKNKYIGRQALAQHFDNTPPGSAERRELESRIIAAMHAGTLDTLMLDMGLQPADAAGNVLGNDLESPNTPRETDDTLPPFLPDYVPARSRKQTPPHFELSDERRDVLAAIAAGLTDSPEHQTGIRRRKIARVLTEAGLLAEVTGEVNHRKHAWRLTEAGLKLIRSDDDLQRRVKHRLD